MNGETEVHAEEPPAKEAVVSRPVRNSLSEALDAMKARLVEERQDKVNPEKVDDDILRLLLGERVYSVPYKLSPSVEVVFRDLKSEEMSSADTMSVTNIMSIIDEEGKRRPDAPKPEHNTSIYSMASLAIAIHSVAGVVWPELPDIVSKKPDPILAAQFVSDVTARMVQIEKWPPTLRARVYELLLHFFDYINSISRGETLERFSPAPMEPSTQNGSIGASKPTQVSLMSDNSSLLTPTSNGSDSRSS